MEPVCRTRTITADQRQSAGRRRGPFRCRLPWPRQREAVACGRRWIDTSLCSFGARTCAQTRRQVSVLQREREDSRNIFCNLFWFSEIGHRVRCIPPGPLAGDRGDGVRVWRHLAVCLRAETCVARLGQLGSDLAAGPLFLEAILPLGLHGQARALSERGVYG